MTDDEFYERLNALVLEAEHDGVTKESILEDLRLIVIALEREIDERG